MENSLRAVADALAIGVVVWRADGVLYFANRRAEDIAGRPFRPGLKRADVVTEYHLVRAGSTEPYPIDELQAREPAAGPVRFTNAEIELPDGHRRPVEGWTVPVLDTDGATRFIVTVLVDVTERRRVEALRVGEARVMEMVSAGVPLEQTLDALARIFEAQADGMLASILLIEGGKRIRHGAAPSLSEAWNRAIDGEPIGPDQGSCGTAAYLKEPVIVADIATDPRWRNYRDAALSAGLRACWSLPIMGPGDAVLGTFALYYTEIREPTPALLDLARHASGLAAIAILHQRHEAAILESEARARLIVERGLHANVQMDSDGIVTGWNVRAAAIFGWTEAETLGRPLATLIIPERLRERHAQGLRQYLATGAGPILDRRFEIAALHRKGHEFPIELAITPIRRGDRVFFSAFIEDITAAKQAQEALRESQQHLSLVYDHVDDVLFQLQVEPEGYRFISVNPAFSAVTGLPATQIVGKMVHEVIPEPSRTLVVGKYAEAIRTRQTVRWEETTAYPTGTRHGDVAITPVYDAQGLPKYLVGSVRDVTEHRRMEDEVRQLQKLEAIGRLSGGIAHDFNNILGVILGVGNLLLKDTKDPDKHAQIEEIVQAGERGASLTRQFLAFGRQQMMQPRVLDLGDVVRDHDAMLRRLIREDTNLKLSLAPTLWHVLADPGQLTQVLMNLVVNARDAMPSGGTVTIETANVDLDAEFARTHPPLIAGPCVMLAVIDSGHGMSEETRKHIFEPFFTTKEHGKGTGLGLATVYGIVKQSGGYIWVDSAPGQGAAFKIYLPRSSEVSPATPVARAERRTPTAVLPADLRVLVVEDEPALRRAIERMLKRLKCDVTMAATGDDAVREIKERGLAPDLLLTDSVMPGMSGYTLARQLRALQPGLKVLHMSGYAGAGGAELPAPPEPAAAFLQKPFTINELSAAIQAVLENG